MGRCGPFVGTLKSSAEINNREVWSNLILKATETIRYQWVRKSVIGFLVCGIELRLLNCERSGVFSSHPIKFGQGGVTLVKCILAGLVLPPAKLGFFEHLPFLQQMPSNQNQTLIVFFFSSSLTSICNPLDYDRTLIVCVDGEKFELGKQIVGPPKDHLDGRSTCIQLARKIGQITWSHCFKSSWPYKAREHEGNILEKLKGISGIVEVLAWDIPSLAEWPSRRKKFVTITNYSPTPLAHELLLWSPLQRPPLLYKVVDSVVAHGLVHRDLSWSNVRICRDRDSEPPVSVVLIDFDLAARVVGTSTGSPDKTGTPLFMPIQVLFATEAMPVHHQELHEYEAVFWIGFLGLISRSRSGHEHIQQLDEPNPELKSLANAKIAMISDSFREFFWPSWFCNSLNSVPAKDEEADLLRTLCGRILDIQFGKGGVFVYPRVDQMDDSGLHTHSLRHEEASKRIAEELKKAIESLIYLRQVASVN